MSILVIGDTNLRDATQFLGHDELLKPFRYPIWCLFFDKAKKRNKKFAGLGLTEGLQGLVWLFLQCIICSVLHLNFDGFHFIFSLPFCFCFLHFDLMGDLIFISELLLSSLTTSRTFERLIIMGDCCCIYRCEVDNLFTRDLWAGDLKRIPSLLLVPTPRLPISDGGDSQLVQQRNVQTQTVKTKTEDLYINRVYPPPTTPTPTLTRKPPLLKP